MTDGWMHVRLLPALPEQLRPQDLPSLPEWFPLPPRDESGDLLPPHTPEQRDQLRRARAIVEAVTGPADGMRNQVRVSGSGAPPEQIVMYDGSVVYVLDPSASTKHQAAYRYSPALSHVHAGAMRAVEEGFREYGQQYAMEASTDDTSQLGYAQRNSDH